MTDQQLAAMQRLLAEYHRKLANEAVLDVQQQYHADLAQRLADEAALIPRRAAIFGTPSRTRTATKDDDDINNDVDAHGVLHYSASSAILTSVFLTALVLVSFAIYFMPTIIAYVRDHHSVLAIFVANFFLGWTFLGWVGALVWSVMPVGSRTATA